MIAERGKISLAQGWAYYVVIQYRIICLKIIYPQVILSIGSRLHLYDAILIKVKETMNYQ